MEKARLKYYMDKAQFYLEQANQYMQRIAGGDGR